MRHIEVKPNIQRLTYQVPEVAQMLGVSRDLIYKLVRTKQIPCRHLGNRIIFPRDKFDAWLEGDADDGNSSTDAD
jgi:excisionase family DNA binding protein